MRNRIYNLGTGFKILGLSLDDLTLLVLSWFISFQIIGGMLPERMRFIFGIAVTAGLFMLWRATKDRVPSGFLPHFLGWIAERSSYDVTPDINPQPVYIDHDKVDEVHAQDRRTQAILKSNRRQARKSSRRK